MNNPLVSIIVITYNSSKYVLETLESAKAQTYRNIELIISDDGSKDDTVEICKNWLDKNQSRFIRTELIKVDQNTGTSGNCNRGVKAGTGEWIKIIAGDDVFTKDCISLNLDFVQSNKDIKVVHSNSRHYYNTFHEMNFLKENFLGVNYFRSEKITALEQYRILLRHHVVNTPTLFISLKALLEIGLFDESIKLIEDWPLVLNLTNKGNKIHYLDINTILYRVHEKSVYNSNKNHAFFLDKKLVYKKYVNDNVGILESNIFSLLDKINELFLNHTGNKIYNKSTKIIFIINQKLISIFLKNEKK
ncbi:MAG: glycosyltransferase family 2 protein [Bacteroidota bacterium]